MPFSKTIPPSPSPIESKRLFYTSVSLLLSHIQGYHYHLSKFHTYVLVYCIGVFLSGLLHSENLSYEQLKFLTFKTCFGQSRRYYYLYKSYFINWQYLLNEVLRSFSFYTLNFQLQEYFQRMNLHLTFLSIVFKWVISPKVKKNMSF